MKAARVLKFGPPNVIINDDLPRPEPDAGQLLVRIKAAGVGNWDALIREGKVESLYRSFSAPSYQELSRESDNTFQDSRLAAKCTERQMSNSPGHTRNLLWLQPE